MIDQMSFLAWMVMMEKKFPVMVMTKVISSYNLLVSQVDNHQKHHHVSKKNNCRYCGAYDQNDSVVKQSIKSGNLVSPQLSSFSKLAHAVPTLIGNKNLIAKDECNTCNEFFSLLENDLARFLGVSRTTGKISGRNGIPKTKFNDNEFIDIVDGDFVFASTENSTYYSETEEFMIVEESKKYHPQNVYKIFVKMAMSILPKDKLVHFEKTIKWLKGDYKTKDEDRSQFCFTEIKWPVRNIYPFITVDLYERKFDLINIPFLFARISFGGYAFQFNIPFAEMNNLVKDFNIPPIIKNEYPYSELLKDNALWARIIDETSVKKLDLFLDESTVVKDKQYFSKGNSYKMIDKESLPKSIKDYLDKKGIKY